MSSQTKAPPALNPAQLGVWGFLGTVTMLFAAFVSAYLVRRTATDWTVIDLPTVLWLNTGILLASSVTLEAARSRALRRRTERTRLWLIVTSLLGAAFLAGQLLAWRQLVAAGVYVPTSPHSAFFYLLTGLHGLHLVGGLAILGWVTFAPIDGFRLKERITLAASYWHFMGGLWVFLFLVLRTI